MSYMVTNNNELYHYGVLGMKWGVRRAKKYESKARTARESANEWDEMARDASAKGKNRKAAKYTKAANSDRADAKRYDSKSKYEYKSHTTKKYEKKALKTTDAAKAEIYKKRAKRSADLDRREQSVAEKTKTGKVIATRLLTGGVGAKSYQRFQAMGDSKGKALGKAAVDVMLTGGLGGRIDKAFYIREGE